MQRKKGTIKKESLPALLTTALGKQDKEMGVAPRRKGGQQKKIWAG